jgi:hypothetical protein
MATFKFKGESYSPGMYQPPGRAPFSKTINTADLVANGGLANASDVPTALPATGFAIGDVLQVFQVSLGFCLRHVGIRVTKVCTNAATVALGNNSATQTHLLAASSAGYKAATALNALATSQTLVASAHLGADTYNGVVFVTNGSIDGTFAGAADPDSIWDVWAHGYMAF